MRTRDVSVSVAARAARFFRGDALDCSRPAFFQGFGRADRRNLLDSGTWWTLAVVNSTRTTFQWVKLKAVDAAGAVSCGL